MSQRWTILAVLFLARLTMAFQFQSAASLSPWIQDSFAVGLAEIGVLIGLYLAPGVVVALPGSAIAAWFGDRRVVLLSMGLMLLGGVLAMAGPDWRWVLAGRVLGGIGGVVINIVMTKMLVDWFAGHAISTAMGIYINSWPVGIALALLVLPGVAASGGLVVAEGVVLTVIAVGFGVFAVVYRSPPQGTGPVRIRAARLPVMALSLAAGLWGVFNAALAIVFSFGPAVLIDAGWAVPQASSAISLFMVMLSLGIPLGGVLADWSGRRDGVILLGLSGFLLLPLIWVFPGAALWILVVAALVFGMPGGPIMALPSEVLSAEARSFGMGIFFSVYYAVMMVTPPIAGAVAEGTGWAGSVIWLGVGFVLLCMAMLAGFRWRTRALTHHKAPTQVGP